MIAERKYTSNVFDMYHKSMLESFTGYSNQRRTVKILTGNQRINKSSTRGWAVGHFAKGIAQTEILEIKLWRYNGTVIEYPFKLFPGHEFIVADSGSIAIIVREGTRTRRFVLSGETRDWILLPPGTRKRVEVLRAPTCGTTVRWPSMQM